MSKALQHHRSGGAGWSAVASSKVLPQVSEGAARGRADPEKDTEV